MQISDFEKSGLSDLVTRETVKKYSYTTHLPHLSGLRSSGKLRLLAIELPELSWIIAMG